jgi:hypothetical protein
MNRNIRSSIIHSFVMIVLVATTPAANLREHEITGAQAQDRVSRNSAPPIVLAQGRCFNGRCY